ncbi:hypothetical protein J4E85_007813 [Alternaria conjuncta]|uniref:uncharacterized protein n=1 Tax=Alternaria conjuncta TaxID=181017 RepID=UPI0022200A8F|nr:uncharacterized protein J4E85_007813 [Alternaria conjuncta]KAI4924696.1 hypothetical protein J4E85_007813 [Alternaria conjuncta]
MSGSQRRSGGSSNGPGRNGGGSRSSSSRGHSYANSTSGGGAPTPSTQNNGYDPRNDSVYAQVQRSSWPYHAYANGATDNQAQSTAPRSPRRQVQGPRASNGPYQFETDHSSSHLRVQRYQMSESDFHSSPPPHASSSAERRAQPDPYQPPIGGNPSASTAPQRSGPYDAVGYIRRDGAVFDRDEVYEEYRPYDPYAHQHGQQRFNGSN